MTYAIADTDLAPITVNVARLSALANDVGSLLLRLRRRRFRVVCNAGAQYRASSDRVNWFKITHATTGDCDSHLKMNV